MLHDKLGYRKLNPDRSGRLLINDGLSLSNPPKLDRCPMGSLIHPSPDRNASAVVSAVQAHAKINSAGQWINRVEGINMNELFERMTREEQEAYARDGTLPGWFSNIGGATGSDSQQGEMEG